MGLEMEGGHYQRAISAAIIKGHVPADTRVRYAYYASDNPLLSGETLAAGPMGAEGIRPTYMITKVILEKILAGAGDSDSDCIPTETSGRGNFRDDPEDRGQTIPPADPPSPIPTPFSPKDGHFEA